MSKCIQLNGRLVGDSEPMYIIAEGGLTNWGELSLAKKQVDAALAAGCDAIKFQAQTTEDLVSKKESPHWYNRIKYKELSHDELLELWEYCSAKNIQCFITAHTDVDLDFLDKKLNVPFFKIGSGESINHLFLENVGSRKKPVIMSLGLHLTDTEIKESVRTLEKAGTTEIILLHCNTVYPTPYEINDLNAITRLKKMFDYPVGYSDHTIGWHVPIAARALGATVLEKHISFDKSDTRSLDCPGSGTPEDWKYIVDQIRDVEDALCLGEDGKKKQEEVILKGRTWASQSVTARHNIPADTKITTSMLILKRPGTGLSSDDIKNVIGKKAKKSIEADSFIKLKDLR